MPLESPEVEGWAERWDSLYKVLAAEPRRMIIASLLDAPRERRIPLPDAAESPNQPMDSETLRIQLMHNHLPLLADAGYVYWEEEPFVVRRGPQFEEPAHIIEMVTGAIDELPPPLINNCKIFKSSV